MTDLSKVYAQAEQREQYASGCWRSSHFVLLAESKAIEGQGGYQFDTQAAVPNSFNFGA